MKTALVTGGNRGIGYEVCRQLAAKGYFVILAARDEAKARAAAAKIKGEGGTVEVCVIDVNDEASIKAAGDWVDKSYGRLDVLVNNAGILIDKGANGEFFLSSFEAPAANLEKTFKTNVIGPFLMMRTFLPMMMKQKYGRVVNVSSGMGQLSEMSGGWPGYRTSKTALNALTRIFAEETQGNNILVNSVCPGWVKTDMGGPDAERPVEEGADTIVWLATLEDNGPTGGFFRDRKKIDW